MQHPKARWELVVKVGDKSEQRAAAELRRFSGSVVVIDSTGGVEVLDSVLILQARLANSAARPSAASAPSAGLGASQAARLPAP
jgi:hypothetical protein